MPKRKPTTPSRRKAARVSRPAKPKPDFIPRERKKKPAPFDLGRVQDNDRTTETPGQGESF